MFNLENETLQVSIAAKGAELKRVLHKQHNLEYMWQSDPVFWPKSSPVLFPIVGQLKNNTYRHNGATYQLPRHGFARDREFSVEQQQADTITFRLDSDAETLEVYPFSFSFLIRYTLQGDRLTVTYEVQNTGESEMLFSVGGHPAFRVPLVADTAYDDYELRFSEAETAGRWPISKDGLIETQPDPLLEDATVLPLNKALFEKDAIVLKNLKSDSVQLVSPKTPSRLQFSFRGFPFLGLWAAPGADFVCIEPWCGIADSVNADGELAHKEGINTLEPSQTFSVAWSVQFF